VLGAEAQGHQLKTLRRHNPHRRFGPVAPTGPSGQVLLSVISYPATAPRSFLRILRIHATRSRGKRQCSFPNAPVQMRTYDDCRWPGLTVRLPEDTVGILLQLVAGWKLGVVGHADCLVHHVTHVAGREGEAVILDADRHFSEKLFVRKGVTWAQQRAFDTVPQRQRQQRHRPAAEMFRSHGGVMVGSFTKRNDR
jgi:hypothetical protein